MMAMAFSATLSQILEQSKRCTRREAAGVVLRLRAGDLVRAVDRRQGLRQGQKARTLAVLRVESVTPAPPLTLEEVALEGFAGESVAFVESILRRMYGARPLVRVAFGYVAIAAPRLHEAAARIGIGVDGVEYSAHLGHELAAAGRKDPRRKELRALQTGELLLSPEAHRDVCRVLDVAPLDLWRAPRTPRPRVKPETVDDGQRDLFR